MYPYGGRGSCYGTQPGAYSHVNSVPSSCHGRVDPPLPDPKSLLIRADALASIEDNHKIFYRALPKHEDKQEAARKA